MFSFLFLFSFSSLFWPTKFQEGKGRPKAPSSPSPTLTRALMWEWKAFHFQPTTTVDKEAFFRLLGFTPFYSRVQKSIENFDFKTKKVIFQRTRMRKGGLPLPLPFQYLILMIWRACDLDLVMISLLASKCQDCKHRGLQFHLKKQLRNGHSNFKDFLFWSQ